MSSNQHFEALAKGRDLKSAGRPLNLSLLIDDAVSVDLGAGAPICDTNCLIVSDHFADRFLFLLLGLHRVSGCHILNGDFLKGILSFTGLWQRRIIGLDSFEGLELQVSWRLGAGVVLRLTQVYKSAGLGAHHACACLLGRCKVLKVRHTIVFFGFLALIKLTLISGTVENSRVTGRIEILGFPVRSNETSRFLEVSSLILMLFLALDLSLDTGASLAPLIHQLFGFFLSALLLKLTILLLPPDSF